MWRRGDWPVPRSASTSERWRAVRRRLPSTVATALFARAAPFVASAGADRLSREDRLTATTSKHEILATAAASQSPAVAR